MIYSSVISLCFFGLTLAAPSSQGNGTVVPEPRNGCQYSANLNQGQKAYLQSPNWPNAYPNNADCKYTLTSPKGTRMSMDCTEFNVEYTQECTYDRVTISLSGKSDLSDGMVVCGQGTFSRTSTSNALIVGFKSDSSNPRSQSVFRFECVITVEGTPEVATQAPALTTAKPPTPDTSFQSCSCGTRNENTRIVGGVNAGVNEFPWRVAMYSPNFGVFCGGTVISANYVLTAQHCTRALKRTDVLYANVGDHDLSTTSESSNQLIKCDRIIEHERYNNQTQDNDIALCHLEKPLTFSRTIQPACLPWSMTNQNFQGKTVTASGWGTTSSGGSSSMVLKKVDLPVKTTEECRSYYQDAITNNMFCTYSAGKDTCQGDSGGSIDYRDPQTSRYFAIGVTRVLHMVNYGVVSWGVGCAGRNQPGVYVKMTNYLQWLTDKTSGEQFCQ